METGTGKNGMRNCGRVNQEEGGSPEERGGKTNRRERAGKRLGIPKMCARRVAEGMSMQRKA